MPWSNPAGADRPVDKPVETVENYQPARLFTPAQGDLLGIFAKEPLPGQVKTRLCPPLSLAGAAELYRASLEETVVRMSAGPWRTILFFSGKEDYFRAAFPHVELRRQADGDLGGRMAAALQSLLAEGKRAILIGSDTPDLPLTHLQEAFTALHRCDLVLAPSTDGGYVMIGERCHYPCLFSAIPWSTDNVLPLTRRRALDQEIDFAEVADWEDVDDLPSLCRLLLRSPLSATARAASRIIGDLCAEQRVVPFACP